MDEYQKKYKKNSATTAFQLQLDYTPQPADKNPFAEDYNYPTFGFGLKLNRNDVTMHRSVEDGWGMAEEVDYDSRLGNILSAYTTFTRPFLTWPRDASPAKRKFELDYMIGTGISYAKHKYNSGNNVDNELIGSRFLIYFAAGAHATWHLSPSWALTGGVEFYHHSNGALNRPNKGANFWGPIVGVRYRNHYKNSPHKRSTEEAKANQEETSGGHNDFKKGWELNFSLGAGAKTLQEDWQLTQFNTPPDSTRYRTSRFHAYAAYSAQADIMYRYARRWASGIGIDAFYGTYADRAREIEEADLLHVSEGRKVNPWSLGLAFKHNAYYGNVSLRMSVGYYLYRHMGSHAKIIEKPYYERIGVYYSFPRLGGLTIGGCVKAHFTKADLTEFVVSYPIGMNNE
ncbi:MAG: acyloxyacyl hydrolase [Prevotella sp.]|nr:acyloxyacyl hydrolase [Prevotella sp.]